ncbi:MAG: 5'/3'-nucleotidase SurE [Erysipelotrichaceae bacterium]|nr:5'/3'-nucleotidase SurE [Erysipelotrichaceae bacterium]
MNILISNDDGIECPGILALVDEFSKLGDIYVVAPGVQQSAKSHAFTFKSVMRVEERTIDKVKKAYALWGTPCDCVHIGLEFLIKEKIDLVVSGINIGKNAGSDVIYSGTCGAAREGLLMGVPSIAVSLDDYQAKTYEDFTYVAYIAGCVAKKYLDSDFSDDYFLNLNVPHLPKEEIKGIRVCDKYGYIEYAENYSFIEMDGKMCIDIKNGEQEYHFDMNDNDIDASACKNGYITLTPLMADQINRERISEMKYIFDDLKY